MRRLGLLLGAAINLGASPASAFEPMEGCFRAEQACPALRSINHGSNPGGVALEVGTIYELLGANKVAATHFQVKVQGARPRERWVPVGCGVELESCPVPIDGGIRPTTPDIGPVAGASRDNLLAISWQPAFCETHREKPECVSQSEGRFDATSLSLHGLWPQPRERAYCGVGTREKSIDRAGRWKLLPAVQVDAETGAALAVAMPGTQSGLERHEWTKHGTCYGSDADSYFDAATRLLGEINAGPVRALIAGRVGGRLGIDEVRAAFDRGFGPGAGERVDMDCDGRGRNARITELRLNLMGEITATAKLAELLLAAEPAGESCTAGVVDAVGFAPAD